MFKQALILASFAFISAARAQFWEPTPPKDILFLVDGSGSVSTAQWNNIRDLIVEVVQHDVPRFGAHRVGVTTFGSTVNIVVPLTVLLDSNVAQIVQTASTMTKPGGNSYMKDAVRSAATQYIAATPQPYQKYVVMITDGVPNPSSAQSPCSLRTTFQANNIYTFVAGLGPNFSNQYIKCMVDFQAEQMIAWNSFGAEAESHITKHFNSCPGDLNLDRVTDDADFAKFVVAYSALVVPDADRAADMNGDGFVDDTDFQIFVQYYNDLICPGSLPG